MASALKVLPMAALLAGLVGMSASLHADTCIYSGDMAREAEASQASAAAVVVGLGGETSGAASGTALDSRARTEATGDWIPLDTRAPRGLVIILS